MVCKKQPRSAQGGYLARLTLLDDAVAFRPSLSKHDIQENLHLSMVQMPEEGILYQDGLNVVLDGGRVVDGTIILWLGL